jgi:hypothetical protein
MSKVVFKKDNRMRDKTKKLIEEMKKKRESGLLNNKQGKGPSLTWIFIGLLVGLTVIVLAISSYQGILDNNGGTIDGNYSDYYNDFDNYYGEVNDTANELNDQGLLETIFTGFGQTFNTFVVGLGAIAKLFTMVPLIGSMMQTLNSALPGFSALISLMFLVAIVYIGMKYIQARRGTNLEA